VLREELEGQQQSRKEFERLLSEVAPRKNDSARHQAVPSQRTVTNARGQDDVPEHTKPGRRLAALKHNATGAASTISAAHKTGIGL
jgi:hypothetical protein